MRKEKTQDSGNRSTQETNSLKEKDIESTTNKLLLFSNLVLIGFVAYLANKVYLNEIETFSDCGDYFRKGYREDGIYEIQPTYEKENRFNVYCNMSAGGWTEIMRRDLSINDNVNFKQELSKYIVGFGNLKTNHFLGLDYINMMTSVKKRDMMFFIDDSSFKVIGFKVWDKYNHYKLTVEDEYDQMPNDASFLRLNNTRFSAKDVDFDLAVNGRCFDAWEGGWWFTDCFDKTVCLTGLGVHDISGITKFSRALMLIK